ncbi:MAG: S9 family peptidase [Chloroflexota bacterium]|nr:S9 family peptidase [Chloroflexota bacterium]
MIYVFVRFRQSLFLVMNLIVIVSLLGCQSSLATAPSATAPVPSPTLLDPVASSTATPLPTEETSLGEAPAPLITTALPTPNAETLELFEYDQSLPLDVQSSPATGLDGYSTQELTYASPKGGRVPATLLVPTESPGPFAGIIIMHGLPGNRSNNALFARRLAVSGAVVLMIDAPFARPENRNRVGGPLTFDEVDRLEQIQLMVDLRRGVDLLSAREDVDPERLAYVGYSYGAAMGGLLAGIEPRIKAFGLMVGDGGLVAHFTDSDGSFFEMSRLSAEDQAAWLAQMEPIEPIRFVSRAAPASLFFQNALHDDAVMQDDALAYQAAGSEPKRIEWYESNHMLPEEAFEHMAEWLEMKIGIDASQFSGP